MFVLYSASTIVTQIKKKNIGLPSFHLVYAKPPPYLTKVA